MSFETTKQVFKNPFGTARLVEGYSTLNRAKDANITNDQLRALYPDLQIATDNQINGFVELGNLFVGGQVRCQGSAFPREQNTNSNFDPVNQS
ncbi:hypothetical protein QX216_09400 [Vibrio parahaemolyticus]|uniref:hypothetical protein n=1 Tax=Vibrio parahaemolyticus TaxID=670 RepID=UPI0028788104|nr:hypothetical protein [Vibrio parahaemolyticus]EGQ8011598.1 hypothetical protein [Vibrio parahaemolyticus]EHH2420550.1 hypothetical protein [Vibrio parahaemolyticus]EHK2868511.1 hypothetical protein [Vibrio parahaemolyticus]MDS1793925.1 hypothetical protein [Vibrio parahaemolyticus]MDS1942307.1 hypothetical protein [Vibrio parahaemolyticus]